MDQNDIISCYTKNEGEAFRLLFDTFYEPLLLYAFRILQDSKAAEDVVQECFIHLWIHKRLDHFEGELDRFMFRSVKQTALNYIRTRERKKKLHQSAEKERESTADFVQNQDVFNDEAASLYAVINRLPEKCRAIFLMACLDDMKYQAIADTLHISINSVKTQMKIALKFLRQNLKGESFSSILMFLTKINSSGLHPKP